MRYFAIIISLVIVMPVFGQRKKKDDDLVMQPNFVEGLTYSLPRNGIRIFVKVTKEAFEPGPYANYAKQLLNIDNAQNKSTTKWNIDDVKIETFSEPDPAQVYKAYGDAAFLLNLTPEGCLVGVNSKNTSTELASVKTNSFVGKLEKNDGFDFANFNDSPIYSPGDSTNNFRPVKISDEQKAAQAAQRVLDCRLNQYDIAAWLMDGEHPDGEAFKVSLSELKKIEKKYLSLFTGHYTYSNQVYSFDYIPNASTNKGEVVFRFSDEKGVVPVSDLSGKPVMVKINPEKDLTSKYSELAKSKNPAAGESGVYYRMPGIAEIEVTYELKQIAIARVVMAQLGTVAPIPEELLFGEYSLEFHPETGALKSVVKK